VLESLRTTRDTEGKPLWDGKAEVIWRLATDAEFAGFGDEPDHPFCGIPPSSLLDGAARLPRSRGRANLSSAKRNPEAIIPPKYHTIAVKVVTNSIAPHLWKAPRRRDG